MFARKTRRAFTMIEIVVAIVLLTVGALGYAAVTANLARAFLIDSRRARAGEILDTQREILMRQGCALAASGSAVRFSMPVDWSVSPTGPATRNGTVVIARHGAYALAHDSLMALIPCT